MAILVSCVTSKALALHTPEVFRQQRSTGISASARPRQIPIGLTTKSWGINPPIRRATQIPAIGGDPGELLGANLPIPDFSSWVTWLVGAFFLAAPAYWQFRALEDKAEQTAEATIEMVEKVAEAAERIADDVSEAFPGNERLKKAASSVKAVADEIEKDVDKAEAILHKMDEIEEEVDSVVESFTKKGPGKNKYQVYLYTLKRCVCNSSTGSEKAR